MLPSAFGAYALKRYFSFPRGKTVIPELDGLRALAVFLVLGRHAAWLSSSNDTGIVSIGRRDPIIPLLNGWIGVALFFVLSGFLIVFHLLRHGAESAISDGLRYLGARALRIVSAYFAVLFLVVAGLIHWYSVAPEHLILRVAYGPVITVAIRREAINCKHARLSYVQP